MKGIVNHKVCSFNVFLIPAKYYCWFLFNYCLGNHNLFKYFTLFVIVILAKHPFTKPTHYDRKKYQYFNKFANFIKVFAIMKYNT